MHLHLYGDAFYFSIDIDFPNTILGLTSHFVTIIIPYNFKIDLRLDCIVDDFSLISALKQFKSSSL